MPLSQSSLSCLLNSSDTPLPLQFLCISLLDCFDDWLSSSESVRKSEALLQSFFFKDVAALKKRGKKSLSSKKKSLTSGG